MSVKSVMMSPLSVLILVICAFSFFLSPLARGLYLFDMVTMTCLKVSLRSKLLQVVRGLQKS